MRNEEGWGTHEWTLISIRARRRQESSFASRCCGFDAVIFSHSLLCSFYLPPLSWWSRDRNREGTIVTDAGYLKRNYQLVDHAWITLCADIQLSGHKNGRHQNTHPANNSIPRKEPHHQRESTRIVCANREQRRQNIFQKKKNSILLQTQLLSEISILYIYIRAKRILYRMIIHSALDR